MSGDMTFKATARLQIPESCSMADLQNELEPIRSELMVGISVGKRQAKRPCLIPSRRCGKLAEAGDKFG